MAYYNSRSTQSDVYMMNTRYTRVLRFSSCVAFAFPIPPLTTNSYLRPPTILNAVYVHTYQFYVVVLLSSAAGSVCRHVSRHVLIAYHYPWYRTSYRSSTSIPRRTEQIRVALLVAPIIYACNATLYIHIYMQPFRCASAQTHPDPALTLALTLTLIPTLWRASGAVTRLRSVFRWRFLCYIPAGSKASLDQSPGST